MKYLLLIPIVILSAYLLYVRIKYGMTISISATYKKLKDWEKLLFPLTLWSVAIPIIIVGIESVPNNAPEILFFLAGAGICLVGASPMYWSGKMEKTAHYIGSYGGIGFGMVACLVYLFSPLILLSVFLYAIFVLSQMYVERLKLNNHIYWIEVIALVIVCAILYLS